MSGPEGTETGRVMLAVRRDGGVVSVVATFPPGDKLSESIPDGEWADAGEAVEIPIALELLARVGKAAPEPLGRVCRAAVAELADLTSTATLTAVRRMTRGSN